MKGTYRVRFRGPAGAWFETIVETEGGPVAAANDGIWNNGIIDMLIGKVEPPFLARVTAEGGGDSVVQIPLFTGEMEPAVPAVVQTEPEFGLQPPAEPEEPPVEESSVCESCEMLFSETYDVEGLTLCANCRDEYAPEPEPEQEIDPVPIGYLRYRIAYGEKFNCQLDARSAVEAMAIAEMACRRRHGMDFMDEWNATGDLPECEVIGRPKLPVGTEVSGAPVVDPASAQREYQVTIFLGNREISGASTAPTPKLACDLFVLEHVQAVADELGGEHSDVPCRAINAEDGEDHWGIGPVRIPLERVMKFGQMSFEMQSRAKSRLGIRSLDAPPPLPFGGITSADGEPDVAQEV